MKTVLIATTGMSPAVLTETVWALAHEETPVIPDEITVITTISGKTKLEEQLFGGTAIWEDLREKILAQKATSDSRLCFDFSDIIVVRKKQGGHKIPLDNLSDASDHEAFADTIMDELWKHTSKPDTRVIASLAGGFKTMSALMLSTMQLLANPGDRITHVLVSGGLDKPDSNFFFPKNEEQANHIQLIDIPLIPLRRWFDKLNRKPGSYNELVNSSLEAMRNRIGSLTLELSSPKANPLWLKLNDTRIEITSKNYCWLSFFVNDKLSGRKIPYTIDRKLLTDIDAYIKKLNLDYTVAMQRNEEKAANYIYRRLDDLRAFLKKQGPTGEQLANALPKKGAWQLNLPPENLKVAD